MAFNSMILGVAKEALLQHPDSRVRSLKDLQTVVPQVRLIVGSPALKGLSDPDGVGLVDWQVVLYSNGLEAALDLIRFILEYKVQKGLLDTMPDLLAHIPEYRVYPLAAPWQRLTDTATMQLPKPFNGMPPKGRRHVLAQLEKQDLQEGADIPGGGSCEPACTYILTFYGNLYPFKDRFENHRIPGTYVAINAEGLKDFARYVECKSTTDKDGMEKILVVLRNILKDMPVYFINMVGQADDMAMWLKHQLSIYEGEAPAPPSPLQAPVSAPAPAPAATEALQSEPAEEKEATVVVED